MGFACPVCSDPQADAVHLANHLAFTAITGGDEHEAWLDEHVPGWGQLGESELAETVVDYAEETAFPQVFEDTVDRSGVDGGHDHPHDHTHGHGGDLPPGATDHRGISDHDSEVLAEARELTREMMADDGGDETASTNDGTDTGSDETDGPSADGDETQ